MLGVEGWAELRREHFVRGVSIKELARRTGMSGNTIRAALRGSAPPKYQRALVPSKLEPFKDEIHRLLKADPRMPGQRIRELIARLGYMGGKSILDDYLREVRGCLTRRAPISARSIALGRSASSTSGSRRPRFPSAMARRVAGGSLSPVWATRVPAPAR